MREIGKTIRVVRLAKGIKVKELATAAGLSPAFISLVEAGDREPSLTAIRSIADALGVPSDLLIMTASSGSGSLRTTDETARGLADAVASLMEAEAVLAKKLKALGPRKGAAGDAPRRPDRSEHRGRNRRSA